MFGQLRAMIVVSLLASISVHADFRMPRRVYRMSEFEKAKMEATEDGEPIAFVYTSESTSCPKCIGASEAAVDELKSRCVLVYVNASAGEEFRSLPPAAQKALTSPKAGRFIPKTAILAPDLSEVLAVVPYASGGEYDDLLDEAEDAVRDAMRARGAANHGGIAGRRTLTIQPDENRPPRTWTDSRGRELTAALVKEEFGYYHLQTAEGKAVRIRLQNLSRADQEYIIQLKRNGSD